MAKMVTIDGAKISVANARIGEHDLADVDVVIDFFGRKVSGTVSLERCACCGGRQHGWVAPVGAGGVDGWVSEALHSGVDSLPGGDDRAVWGEIESVAGDLAGSRL